MASGGHRARFEDFAARKRREAAGAHIERLSTIVDRHVEHQFRGIGSAWTRLHYGGPFQVAVPSPGRSALSLVFVQSRDGNTSGADPDDLGGGATDKHLIYEGLSRVAAHGVLAGAATVQEESFFSVWHPELVALRKALGLPRHPAQVVISKHGRVNFDSLLFNVPDVPVFLVAGHDAMSHRAAWLRARPWVGYIPLIADQLRPVIDHLRDAERIVRISAIGGRLTASRLIDAGLVQDLYLTTTSRDGGEPGTPWYSGTEPPRLELVTKKQWLYEGTPITFEHFALTSRASACERNGELR